MFHCLQPTNTPSLSQTARVSRASSSRPAPQTVETAPATASAPVSSVPVTGNQNANVAAWLQLLSSAGGMPGNGADLISALAGVYNFGLSNGPATAQPQPQQPAPNPASRPLPPHKERVSLDVVIVKEEEEEIQEIECMPSTSKAPPVRPTPIAATRPTPAAPNPSVKPPAVPTSLPKSSQPPQLPSTLSATGARPRKSSGQAAAQPLGDKENLPPGTVSFTTLAEKTRSHRSFPSSTFTADLVFVKLPKTSIGANPFIKVQIGTVTALPRNRGSEHTKPDALPSRACSSTKEHPPTRPSGRFVRPAHSKYLATPGSCACCEEQRQRFKEERPRHSSSRWTSRERLVPTGGPPASSIKRRRSHRDFDCCEFGCTYERRGG